MGQKHITRTRIRSGSIIVTAYEGTTSKQTGSGTTTPRNFLE